VASEPLALISSSCFARSASICVGRRDWWKLGRPHRFHDHTSHVGLAPASKSISGLITEDQEPSSLHFVGWLRCYACLILEPIDLMPSGSQPLLVLFLHGSPIPNQAINKRQNHVSSSAKRSSSPAAQTLTCPFGEIYSLSTSPALSHYSPDRCVLPNEGCLCFALAGSSLILCHMTCW